jgi:Asp-tRNA(Asn)/Glu-tRNA(Gln) amidotransferase A subunit family amidase
MFATAVRSAAEVFGTEVETIDASQLWAGGAPGEDWFTICATEHVHHLGRDFAAANLDLMHPSARAFMEYGLGVSIDTYLAARRRRFAYVGALDRILGDDAVLLSPVVVASGFLADGRLSADDEPWSVPGDVYNTGLINMTGHPALSAPAGVSPNGVPFGLQLIAPRWHDSWLLDLAATWEDARPWPRTAPGYDAFESALGL